MEEGMISFDNQILLAIIAILAWLLVSGTKRCVEHKSHTIPPKAAEALSEALEEGRPAIFHAGCIDCLWRHQNTTHDGIAYCRGCQYFSGNWKLIDKGTRDCK